MISEYRQLTENIEDEKILQKIFHEKLNSLNVMIEGKMVCLRTNS